MARVSIGIQLRWSDQDEYGHINNVSYARYLEEARVRLFSPSAEREPTGLETLLEGTCDEPHKMVLASQHIEFVNQLHYSETPVSVEMWIGKLGGSSFEVHAELVDGRNPVRTVITRSISIVVLVDGETMLPKRLTAEERRGIELWQDAPLKMRHP